MDSRKKIWEIVQIVAFLLLLGAGAGFVCYGMMDGKTYSERERRELAVFPEADVEKIADGSYMEEFSEAVSDHIFGRDAFMMMRTIMKLAVGQREIDGVYVGDERLIEVYGNEDFDEAQISENIDHLTDFVAMAANGIGVEHVRVALIPSKCTVYADELPWYINQSSRAVGLAEDIRRSLAEKLASGVDDGDIEGDPDGDDTEGVSESPSGSDGFNFDEGDPDGGDTEDNDVTDYDGFNFGEGDPDEETSQAINQNNQGIDDKKSAESADNMVIDLESALLSHKEDYIYYMTDHHWTTMGAGYAYVDLINKWKSSGVVDLSEIGDERVVDNDFLGTDYNRVGYYGKSDAIYRCEITEADISKREINDSGEIMVKSGLYDEGALSGYDKYCYFLGGNFSAITITTTNKMVDLEEQSTNKESQGSTLLLIKDSFANSMVPYLCRNYEMIIMVDPRYVNADVMSYLPEGVTPDDILILYNEEKFMQDTHQGLLA